MCERAAMMCSVTLWMAPRISCTDIRSAASAWLLPSRNRYSRISISEREKKTRKAPAYRTIPLILADFACGTSQNAQKTPAYWLSPASDCPTYRGLIVQQNLKKRAKKTEMSHFPTLPNIITKV
jgi:hypothetical protein